MPNVNKNAQIQKLIPNRRKSLSDKGLRQTAAANCHKSFSTNHLRQLITNYSPKVEQGYKRATLTPPPRAGLGGRVRWYTLQVADPIYSCDQQPVSACPLEHATPSLWGDTIRACGAVSDVVGEACDCHGVALVVLCVCIVSSTW